MHSPMWKAFSLRRPVRQHSLFLLALAALALSGAAPRTSEAGKAHDTVTQIFAFGDSYTDNGVKLNLSAKAVAAGVPNAVVMPNPKLYYQGRYSNGPVAVEDLADKLHVKLTDYAVGGAMSGDQNYESWMDDYTATGLQAQVASFRHDLGGLRADPHALYVVAISANDYFKFVDFAQPGTLLVGTQTPATIQDMADRAAENTALAVHRLAKLGARRFLVSESFDLKGLPYILSAGQSNIADAFATRYNARLQETLHATEVTDGLSIRLFDWGGKTREIIDNAARYGITNTTDACEVTFPVPQPACATPDAYLFWDEYHPSRRAHQILAGMMEQLVRHG
ncbi:Phospholipase/lecithinase/hemolysin [Dyella sp. OK004]|uniref:SGNH/GDSL hydrolase family protein n=1 Tax=Dyella sp. OK004 TaxID=1855292 RepID=UPI0008E249F8|nr:SGNH/GDSL hydrolase family protein [Dyella sp. OK004]SFS18976.1 Phospholipase/lecithinase/hemolysin [Dyella sp. OK004]